MDRPARCLRADAVDPDATPRTIPLFPPEIEMMHSRKPLAALIALGAALAVPTAFAQDATTTAPPHDPATQTNPAPPPHRPPASSR